MSFSGEGNRQYVYDDEGNRTQSTQMNATPPLVNGSTSYVWDGKNRLVKADLPGGGSVRYTYDHQNHRIRREFTSPSAQHPVLSTYVYLGNQMIEEMVDGKRHALYGWDGQGLISRVAADGRSLFYLHDGLGSVMAIIDEKANIVQSYEYSAFGECLSGKDAVNAFRFVGGFGGQTDDDTGLVYFWNRWYDPQVGRWVSEDPKRFEAGTNHYGYVENNPTVNIDPRGLSPGDLYSSQDEAGIAAIEDYNPSSISENQEYGGFILLECSGKYKYTPANRGGLDAVDPGYSNLIKANPNRLAHKGYLYSDTVVADYHTHGDYVAGYDNENFSPQDKATDDNVPYGTGISIDGYLGTPERWIKKYSKGSVSILKRQKRWWELW